MSQQFKARDYQAAIIEHVVALPRVNVWAGMGTGKTVSTLTALDFLLNVMGEAGPALVLAPLRVAASTWPAEAAKWTHLAKLRVVPIIGSKAEREAALRRPADVYTMNYENLPWLREHLGDAWPFRIVVADESTRLKSFRVRQGGARAQALGQIAHKHVDRFINLTGTPAPNGLVDLWGQAWFLDAGQRLGRSFSAFESRWFATKKRHPNDQYGEKFAMPGAQSQIEGALRDVTITVRASDFMDLPPLIENVIEVDLPASARRHYRELEREMFTQLAGGEEVEAFNAAALTMKCLQCANGALYLEDGSTWKELHDEKLEALRSVVEEAAGAPVLVAYNFRSDLERILRTFNQARELRSTEAIDAFSRGEIAIGVGHPKSMGHGVDGLQNHCSIGVFFGSDWNLENRLQIIERIGPTRQVQAGKKTGCTWHSIVARDTVDELVLARHRTKKSVMDTLMDAMKGRQ